MDILHELYLGNISPCDRPTERTDEYRELTQEIVSLEDALTQNLSKEQWELYEKWVRLVFEREAITEEQLFKHGFTLGMRMMLEVMMKDEE